MRRCEDEIFKKVAPALRPAFAKAAAEYVTENGLTVALPYRLDTTTYLVNPHEDKVACLFEYAFLDFCRRDGGTTKRGYERKAKALREAMAALDINDPASVLFYQWDFQTVIRPALEAQADAYERQAAEHGRYARNITWERCVRDRFMKHGPIPKAAQVRRLAATIEKALRPVARALADKISVSAEREPREVRTLLKRG